MAGESFLTMVLLSALSSLAAAVVPLVLYRNGVKKGTLHMLLGVSAGILFAIATIDLIPEGISVTSQVQRQQQQMQADFARKEHVHEHRSTAADSHGEHGHDEGGGGAAVTMVGVGLGFFVLVIMEQFMLAMGVAHSHQGEDTLLPVDADHAAHKHKSTSAATGLSESFSLTAFAALAVHSLVDGVVIGGSFRVSATIGARVAIAIVLHKIPDGFVVASLLTATNRTRKPLWVLALSSITPMGAVLGYALLTGIPAGVLGGVLGFAAGTFLFISACGIIPELLHEGDAQKSKLPIAAVIAGWAGILLVNFTLGAHEH